MENPFRFKIYQPVYQSYDISLVDWFSLLTLCLAPLIVHIVVGVPKPTYLDRSRPKWHQRLCHYNPTSIIWRYAIITDRRIRCPGASWDANVFAATNALFWTADGWDGSEDTVEVSSEQCLRLPEGARAPLFSGDVLSTLIITLQGFQAAYTIASSFGTWSDSTSRKTASLALDTLFFPLALMGLLRLVCACWLTSEYAYAESLTVHRSAAFEMPYRRSANTAGGAGGAGAGTAGSTDRLLSEWHLARSPTFAPARFLKVSFWASILFRVVFLFLLLGLLALPVLYLTLEPWLILQVVGVEMEISTTLFAIILLYLVLFAGTFVILSFYFYRGCTSTIIPCIQSIWYTVYTGIIMALVLVLFVVACLETRKTPCGTYTSFAVAAGGDAMACATSHTTLTTLSPGSGTAGGNVPSFGIATTWPSAHYGTNQTILGPGEYWVYNFTGTCIGTYSHQGNIAQLVQGGNVTNVAALYLGTTP